MCRKVDRRERRFEPSVLFYRKTLTPQRVTDTAQRTSQRIPNGYRPHALCRNGAVFVH